MLKMVEVVGTSPKGYSEAVKAAVDALVAAGEKVHFFTVTEHRGSH
ncbi:MAG: dodecin domain-containing protein, partial [Planctomycetes bacterium]|nr:dodecin domain-containing protein [Planctomycetota bacterium]